MPFLFMKLPAHSPYVVCKICGSYTLPDRFGTGYHLAQHASNNMFGYKRGVLVFDYDGTRLEIGLILQLLEQLPFLRIENGKNYKEKILDLYGVALEENNSCDGRLPNIIDIASIDVSGTEFIQEYVKLLSGLDYSCSVCGKLYECGLPSREIVHVHISTYCMADKFPRYIN